MGIGGSGMSAVAQIAKAYGYNVNGCDSAPNTPYLSHLIKSGIEVFPAHSVEHIQDIDLLAVSPAIFHQNNTHPEIEAARQKNILITWQDFLGKYLHQNKNLICIAGTHGKSTTTAMAGILLQHAQLDPTVEVGATVKAWNNNVLIGNGQWFISEADEYNDNFKSYHPDILILNNIEMDHPEYFQTEDNLLSHFQRLVDRSKTIIFNSDSPLIHKLKLPSNAIPYSISMYPNDLNLSVPGIHNKSNALGILKLATLLNISPATAYSALLSFQGLTRRIDLIGESNLIKIYDDYANHPTAYKAVLSTLHDLYPNQNLIAIIEPHTFSRLRSVLPQLKDSISQATQVIFTKIYASREKDPGDFSSQNLVEASKHPNAIYIPESNDVISHLKQTLKPNDIVVVMGSGNSSMLANQILSSLK